MIRRLRLSVFLDGSSIYREGMGYMSFRIVFLAAATLTLANCGSGSSTPSPTEPPSTEPLSKYLAVFDPVFAPVGAIPLDGSFNLLLAGDTAGATTDKATVGSYGIEFGDFVGGLPFTATLTLPGGQTVVLNRVLDDFVGTSSGVNYTLQFGPPGSNYFVVGLEADGLVEDYFGVGVFGWETPESGLPTSGGATFTGTSFALINVDGDPPGFVNVDGDMELSVNFGTRAVTGDVYRDSSVAISVVDGELVRNGFAGQLAITPTPDIDNIVGTTEGIFYGTGAEEVGGVFEGAFSGPTDSGTVSGSFWGAKAP